jgi:hypothetical protein
LKASKPAIRKNLLKIICFYTKTERNLCGILDFGDFNLNLVAELGRTVDTVQNSLIVDDLAGGNGSLFSVDASIKEGTNLSVPKVICFG